MNVIRTFVIRNVFFCWYSLFLYLCYLSVRRSNSVNSFSIAYPVVFQCRCLCHMACVEFTLIALLCSHCTCLIGVDVRRTDCHEDLYCRERGLRLWDTVSIRLIATQRRCFIVAWSWSFDPETVGS